MVSAMPVPRWNLWTESLRTIKLTGWPITADESPVRTQVLSMPVARPAAMKCWAAAQKSALPKDRIHGKSQPVGLASVPQNPAAEPDPVGQEAPDAMQLKAVPPTTPGESPTTQLVELVPG